MGESNTPPDHPTPLMRLVLALVTATTALCTAGPMIVFLGTLFAVGLFAGAAVSLAHTGALALEPAMFESAHGYGLTALIAFFLAALAYRTARRDAKGLLGAVSRRPVITATIALPVASLVVVRSEWDRPVLPALSGALILDDLYFFSIGAAVLMVVVAGLVARGLYRWAAAGRYRAGLVTGAQAMVLSLLWAVTYTFIHSLQPSPAPPADNAALNGWRNHVVEATRAPSGLEAERQLLVGVDALLEPGRRRLTDPAATTPPAGDDDEIRACIAQLLAETDQVRRSVAWKYRLSDDDARDVVHDALLNVCTAHVRKPYVRLGAVLQTAAERRARRWAWRRGRHCEIDTGWPVCSPVADEAVRFEQEDAILDGAICQEDPVTQEIIRLHFEEDSSFPEVGARLGLNADDARTRWNNARRRIQKRVAVLCGP